MLQNIHDKAKGWVAYAIVGFIAIPFTLFGISSYLGGSDSLVAAEVNGEEIPVQQVQNAVVEQRQRLTQAFGGKLPPGFSDESIKKQAIEQAVSEVLLRQEAENNGYRASNQEVYDAISEIPAFQKDGVFDPATYEKLLAAQRRNKSGFEAEVRRSITNQQFSRALSDAAFLPPNEVARYQRLQNQTRSVETYTLKTADYATKVDVSADEAKAYYDANTANYMSTEKLKLSYIELKQSDLEEKVEVSKEALQSFYDENSNLYIDPEQRKLSHILINIDVEKNGDKAEQKAEEKAQALYDQIKAGSKTFEDLAASESDDEISAKKSGEIGLIARGDMGPAFEKAAFSLNKGDVSEPVKAEAGFEIIKLLNITESKQKPYADVKDEVEKAYRSEQAEKMFFDKSEKLQTLAFENSSSLDAAADATGLKVKSSDWIEKGRAPTSKDIFSSPKLITAAFSEDVLKLGKNSELLDIDSETVALIRMQEHKAPEQKPLADVTDDVKKVLINQKLRKVLIDKGEQVLAKLKEAGDWSAALGLIGASVDDLVKTDDLKRTGGMLSGPIVGKVFSMQKPQEGNKSFDNVILPDGNYVLAALVSVKDGEAEVDDLLRSGFTRSVGSREQQAMRVNAEVRLFPENIQ